MEDKNLRPPEDEKPENETEFIDEQSRVLHNRPRKVYGGMWGPFEIITVGLTALIVLSVLLFYLFFVLPGQTALESNRVKRDSLEAELIAAKKKFGDLTSTETQVARLITSAADFESRFLKDEMGGKTAIYQRLNALINAYGLTNSTGPDYTPLELSENERRQGSDSQSRRGRSKFQSLFPGVYVTMTVEGPYQNLRRFINEIENSREFITISTIELEPAENDNSNNAETPTAGTVGVNGTETVKQAPRGRVRGNVVSLRLEMAAYFQRPNEERQKTSLTDPANQETDSGQETTEQ